MNKKYFIDKLTKSINRLKKNKERLVNIGISKNTHLELLELQINIWGVICIQK